MKLVVREKLDLGMSEKDVYIFLKNQYGDWILYDPEFNNKTYFLWVFPILIFFIGGGIILKKFVVLKK